MLIVNSRLTRVLDKKRTTKVLSDQLHNLGKSQVTAPASNPLAFISKNLEQEDEDGDAGKQ
jgi:hypothetical protein